MKCKYFNYVVAFLAAMMLPLMSGCGVMKKAEQRKLSIMCISNLKQLNLGTMMYSVDNDDNLPEAQGWEEHVKIYVGDDAPFTCPACKKRYTYLGNGQKIGEYKEKDKVIVFVCEGNHLGRTNVAFLDGHLESLNPEEVNVAVEAAKADGCLPIRK